MEKKFNKTKYAAVVLASTMALSTVASVTPQVFGESTITAQAATGTEVKGETVTIGTGEDAKTADVIKVNGKTFTFTITSGKVTIKDSKDKEVVKDAAKDDVVKIEKKNYSVTTVAADGATAADKLVLTELKEVKPADVTKAIKALDITKAALAADSTINKESDFEKAVKAIEDDLKLLTADELKKLESSTKLLAAYKTLGSDADLVKAISELPKADDLKDYKTYSTNNDGTAKIETKTVTKGKKEVKEIRGVNDELDAAVLKLEAFKALYTDLTKKENTSAKDNKTVLAAVQKQYTEANKTAVTNQKLITAEYFVDPFEAVYKVLTEGGTYNVLGAEIKNSKGKFKIDGDQYIATVTEGTLKVTDPHGEEVETTAGTTANSYTFEVDNYDEQKKEDDKFVKDGESTLTDTIQITLAADGSFTIAKVEESITLNKAVPVLTLDTKSTGKAYKALKAGTGKYNDAQIEIIQAASSTFKGLTSDAKKLVKKEDQTKLKEYEKALKAQQSLEKKMLSEDAKGVTTKIKNLKYGAVDKKKNNEPLYSAELVLAAKEAYDALTPKFKKKVSASVVADLNAHLDTYELIEDIDALTEDALLTSTTATDKAFTDLKADVAAAKATYNGLSTSKTDKVGKKKQGLVKNYKNLTALEKLIETQEKYYTANATDGDLKAWKDALSAITGTEDVQVINNKFAAGETVYEVEYDKKAKAAKIKGASSEAVKENDKGVITLTPAEGYTVTVTKGKVKVDKTVTAENKFDLKSLNSKMSVADFDALGEGALYTSAQIKAIEDARAANKALSKDSKKFSNAADEKTLKAYETDVKTQKALEKKSLSTAVKAINDGIKNLKYTDSDYATKITEVKSLLTAFDSKYAGDTAALSQIKEATKTTLTDHEAVSAVKATLDAVPKADAITADTLTTDKAKVTAARTAFDKLSATQKKIAKDAETAIKAAESKVTELEKPAA